MRFTRWGITAWMLFQLFGCSEPFAYKAEHAFPQGKWAYADTVDFNVPVSDTSHLYNLYIEFNHVDTFPNQNIYLKLYTRFPSGKRVNRIRSFDLFDVEGKATGKCSGDECSTRLLLQDNLYFNQLGDHLITLEQFTRSNPVGGIRSVGILLEKTDKKR